MGKLTITDEEIAKIMENTYEGDIPEGYELKKTIYIDSKGNEWIFWELVMTEEHKKQVIENRIIELRMKLIDGTITAEEREELKLLIW